MALAIDAVSSTNGVAANTITLSHTTSGSDRGLIVGVSLTAAQTVTGVTYNGVSMTQEATDTHSLAASLKVYIFSLIAPASGANDVVVTCSGASNVVVGAISFTGAHQTTMTGGATNTEGNASPATINVSSASDEIVVDTINVNAGPDVTVGASQTNRWELVQSGTGAGSTETGAATTTMSWTFSDNIWVSVALAVKPSASATTTDVSIIAAASVAAILVKSAALTRGVTTVGVADDTMQVGKILTASSTGSAALTVMRVVIVELIAAASVVAAIVKSAGLNATTTVLGIAGTVMSVGKQLSADATGTANRVLSVGKILTASVTGIAAITVTFIAAAVTTGKNRLVGLIRGIGLAGRP